MQFDSLKRRDFITLLGGTAATWPLAARAQQPEQMRRIGVLISPTETDPESQARIAAFKQGLQVLGWITGRNFHIDYRFGAADLDRTRAYAAELIGLAPDVILANSPQVLRALHQLTSTIPIVFALVVDPVGAGFVGSLARPGGNATGFASMEFGLSAKLLELLKQMAPRVARVAVVRNAGNPVEVAQFGAIQAVAPSLGVELTPIIGRDSGEIEHDIGAFARGGNGGLVVTGAGVQQIQRDTIVAAAAQHKLPAVYVFRGFVAQGGLISYGIDQTEPYRLAAGYVDRILKGEKPADLPVQAPTKYDLVINLKTAKALGLEVPPTLLARADEVIE